MSTGLGGGGSNILRGGKRTYDCKTLVGNFVEETYRPNAVTSHWSGGAAFESTACAQMLDAGYGVARVKEFGAGLKLPDDRKYNYNQIIHVDKTRGSSTWQSLSQSAFNNSSKPTEFAAPRVLQGKPLPPDELERHRERWTRESESMRNTRYVTEGSATQDHFNHERFRKQLTKPTPSSFK